MQLRWMLGVGLVGATVLGLSSCGGDDSLNAPPEPVIASPAEGATFKAGDTIRIELSASDPQDGILSGASLSWWVDFHHDTHTHPFALPTTGTGATLTVPTRGETSDNVWLRIHLRATDSTGASTEVTRDVMPQKVQIALSSQPAGLQLSLDGQPVTAPHILSGVVGLERDLGATDQIFDGRRYRFSTWSDGGAAMHTIATPATDVIYTAVFIDLGPAVNALPAVAITAPANGSNGTAGAPISLTADASDRDGTIANVQFFDGSTAIGAADATAPYSVTWTPSTPGVHLLTARATDDRGATTTSTAVRVTIEVSTSDIEPPAVTVVEPVALADNLTGTFTFRADAVDNVGVASVEFQVDGVTLVTDTSAPYSATVNTGLHAAGQHVLRARARDGSGNQSDWTQVLVRFGGTREVPAGITRALNWATGFSVATTFTELPDGRLLVAQQNGALRVVQSDGTLLMTPMLTVAVDSFQDRGLLGVVAHPQFSSNGFIYVYYAVPATQGELHYRLSRFTVSGNTASGERVLADLPPVTSGVHGGGGLRFGADGKLYLGAGEAGVPSNAQDLNTPYGKLLRFNDDGSIPADNPFCTTQGNLACATWAYGLRNPFTLAVQPGTGRMHINDVGATQWEEIDVAVRGANYGWPASQGPNGVTANITAPLFTYNHAATAPPGSGLGGFIVGSCVIGGAFYPDGGPFPAPWRGGYFFTDCVTSFLAFIDLNNGNAAYSFGTVPGPPSVPVGMLVARDGALLVLQRYGITRFTAP